MAAVPMVRAWFGILDETQLAVEFGIFWSGLMVKLCGCEVQALQTNS